MERMESDEVHPIEPGAQLMGWELEDVEKPFVAQLQAQSWAHIEASLDDSTVTCRVRVTPLLEGATPFVQQAAAPFVQQPVGHPGA